MLIDDMRKKKCRGQADSRFRFGVTGAYANNVQGVGLSVDGGKTFTTYNASLSTWARYGAFPTDTQVRERSGSEMRERERERERVCVCEGTAHE